MPNFSNFMLSLSGRPMRLCTTAEEVDALEARLKNLRAVPKVREVEAPRKITIRFQFTEEQEEKEKKREEENIEFRQRFAAREKNKAKKKRIRRRLRRLGNKYTVDTQQFYKLLEQKWKEEGGIQYFSKYAPNSKNGNVQSVGCLTPYEEKWGRMLYTEPKVAP